MKHAFVLSIMLCSLFAKSQGPQQLVNVPIAPGSTVPGWIYLPADYQTSTTNYPVVFFYHGLGEAGTNPYLLLNNGVPYLIAHGMRPDNVTNPVDRKSYSFIVVSVQHWSWSPNPNWLPYEMDWLKQNYRVDTNRVYVTGLSAGGQGSFNVAVDNSTVSGLIAASVPMSPAALGSYDISMINTYQIKTWFFSGDADPGYTANATNYSSQCNSQYPGSSKLNIFSGGHCCWVTYYNTAWHDATTGLSIWEWMLTNTRQTQIIQPLPVTFLSFDVKKEAGALQLDWFVTGEQDVSRYEIEKSREGVSFTMIGLVNASGKDHYSFTDDQLADKCFYRIKSVDLNGKYQYSSIASYRQGRASMVLKAFPTPAHGEVIIQHSTATKDSKITVSSVEGKLLMMILPKPGLQHSTIDLSSVKAGLYFVHYQDGTGANETMKIIKQ
jgi:hypothetical protein